MVLDKNQNFLMLREKNGYRDLPGGGLELNETPLECIEREVSEETGFEMSHKDSEPCFFTFGKSEYFNNQKICHVIYKVILKMDANNFKPSDECVSFEFINPKDILSDKVKCYTIVKKFAKVYLETLK